MAANKQATKRIHTHAHVQCSLTSVELIQACPKQNITSTHLVLRLVTVVLIFCCFPLPFSLDVLLLDAYEVVLGIQQKIPDESGSFRGTVTKAGKCKSFNSLEVNGLICITVFPLPWWNGKLMWQISVSAHKKLPARSRVNLWRSFEFPDAGRARSVRDPTRKLPRDTARSGKCDENPANFPQRSHGGAELSVLRNSRRAHAREHTQHHTS